MKYFVVNFSIEAEDSVETVSDACDLLAALAADAGFETFEETEDGLAGFVQQQLFDHERLDAVLREFPMSNVCVSYTVDEAEDRDWNEQWEQEGFAPIVVGEKLVVYDGRHDGGLVLSRYPLQVEIDARLAFGTGTHETTRMVCSVLLSLPSAGRRVLDCGCGTGILGIVAMKLGARECVAYDIDEWSVDNTRHNAVINQVELTPLHGDAHVLEHVEGNFDLVMANINRNILLADMPMFRSKMAAGALLVLSGFYTADVPLLTDKATALGMSLERQLQDNDWACLVFRLSDGADG